MTEKTKCRAWKWQGDHEYPCHNKATHMYQCLHLCPVHMKQAMKWDKEDRLVIMVQHWWHIDATPLIEEAK